MIGGSPNPGDYETRVKSVQDSRIVFPGYVYGDDTNILIKNASAYIQPSLIEGLSPVILTVMGIGTPLICSDIIENTYITKDNAVHFKSGDAQSLKESIIWVLNNPNKHQLMAEKGKRDVQERFNWDLVSDQYIELFKNKRI